MSSVGADYVSISNLTEAAAVIRTAGGAGAVGASSLTARDGRVFLSGATRWNDVSSSGPVSSATSFNFWRSDGLATQLNGTVPFPHAFNTSGDGLPFMAPLASLVVPALGHMLPDARAVRMVSPDPLVGLDAPTWGSTGAADAQCGYPQGASLTTSWLEDGGVTAIAHRPRPFRSIRAAAMASPRNVRVALMPGVHDV